MQAEGDLKKMVDDDIAHCESVWESSSHDKDALSELFSSMMFRYSEKIDGFTEDMWVVMLFEDSAHMAKTYRANIMRLIDRLKAFRDNGYKNEGLRDFCINKERMAMAGCSLDFSQVRINIGMMPDITAFEKDEIMQKIGEIEEICAKPIAVKKKWDMLRGYVVWLSGKEAEIALMIWPLFLNIQH